MDILDLRRDWQVIDQPELGETNTRLIARKDARVNGRVYVAGYTRRKM